MWSADSLARRLLQLYSNHFRATLNNLHPNSTCCRLGQCVASYSERGCVISVTYTVGLTLNLETRFRDHKDPVPQSVTESRVINHQYKRIQTAILRKINK